MKMVGRRNQNQRGYILALSLVIMLFGALVVGSLLTFVSASINSWAIGRDNLNAYYAADAGIQAMVSKMLAAEDPAFDPEEQDPSEQFGPITERNETTNPDFYYTLSELTDGGPDKINTEYRPRVTVEYEDMAMPDYIVYKITSSAYFHNSETGKDELRDTVTAVIRQTPYPIYGPVIGYKVSILSWERR